ncbi:MAG: substrate-binding domain-containing protein [Actinobacteria bacterium]|nr:substrate-binding domain-containing protein [Actinomycetota bacterium]
MAVSVRDVARRAGVSVGTVSNVLNSPDKVSQKTAVVVQKAIDSLGFVRNDAARQLRAGKSRSIGLVVLDIRNPFFAEVSRGAEEAAKDYGLSVLFANSDEDFDRENSLLVLFEEQRVAGILLSPLASDLSEISRIRDRGTPVVLVDRKSRNKTFSSVSVDDVAGGFLAVEHLSQVGKKKIVFAGGPLEIEQIADRLKGAKKAAEAMGIKLELAVTKNLTVLEGRALAAEILSRPKKLRPDGIFAANDLLAIGIMQALVVAPDVSIPNDIALVGYDDISFAGTALISLTSIRQPSLLIGAQAVELLMQETDPMSNFRRRQVVFQPELVVRDSTRPQSPDRAKTFTQRSK